MSARAKPFARKPEISAEPDRAQVAAIAIERLTACAYLTATEISEAASCKPAFASIVLGGDSRFEREVVGSTMQWRLTAQARISRPMPRQDARSAPAAPAAPPAPKIDQHSRTMKLPTIASEAMIAVELPEISEPMLRVEEISPERAAGFLALSRGNRKLRMKHVQWIARQMTAGDWLVTPNAIAVSASGRLLDGHHRLQAVIVANEPVRLAVSYGWRDETWSVIDCGILRTAPDRITLYDDPYWNRRAIEIVNCVRRCEHGLKSKLTNTDVLTGWKELGDGIEIVRRHLPAPIHHLTPTCTLAPLARYAVRQPEKAAAFMEIFRTGQADRAHPAIALRTFLLSANNLSGGSASQALVYWTVVAAVTAHELGRTAATLTPATTWEKT